MMRGILSVVVVATCAEGPAVLRSHHYIVFLLLGVLFGIAMEWRDTLTERHALDKHGKQFPAARL